MSRAWWSITAPFNLSILECKYERLSPISMQARPFNLSILECKWQYGRLWPRTWKLLISPYWNVNDSTAYVFQTCLILLISPYWNVNRRFCKAGWHISRPFNLSILECKWRKLLPYRVQPHTFNLSILECKCPAIVGAVNTPPLLISPYWNVNAYSPCHGHSLQGF